MVGLLIDTSVRVGARAWLIGCDRGASLFSFFSFEGVVPMVVVRLYCMCVWRIVFVVWCGGVVSCERIDGRGG